MIIQGSSEYPLLIQVLFQVLKKAEEEFNFKCL